MNAILVSIRLKNKRLTYFGRPIERSDLFKIENLRLNSLVYLNTFFKHFGEFLNFFNCERVSLLLLFDNLKRSMSFAEDLIKPLPLNAFNLHKVITAPCTFNMERYHTLRVLALYTSAFFDPAYNTLQSEAFVIDFV